MDNDKFILSFTGNAADDHQLDFYDAAQALEGFQRSLALTAHLVVNGEIITKAPFQKGAKIMVSPVTVGSWEIVALVGFATPALTPILQHLMKSAYSYLVKSSLGFHVDFDKTLGEQYEEVWQKIAQERKEPPLLKIPKVEQLDSLAEKCERSLKQLHRPIIGAKTAVSADISCIYDRKREDLVNLDVGTYDYINFTRRADAPIQDIGRISGYNSNTYEGRIFLPSERRPIPFELEGEARSPRAIKLITDSLGANALSRFSETENAGDIIIEAFRHESKMGVLKKLSIIRVIPAVLT